MINTQNQTYKMFPPFETLIEDVFEEISNIISNNLSNNTFTKYFAYRILHVICTFLVTRFLELLVI